MPATIRNVPDAMTKEDQQTMRYHLMLRWFDQLSYNHIQPMSWKDMSVPSKAPIRDPRPPKTGMALAMM